MDCRECTELNRLRMVARRLDNLEPEINYLALVVGIKNPEECDSYDLISAITDWAQKEIASKTAQQEQSAQINVDCSEILSAKGAECRDMVKFLQAIDTGNALIATKILNFWGKE